MVLLIFYIWLIDLFLYSNTEIFIIFFIFSSFGIFFYSITVWYSEYLDELITLENQKLYFLIFVLKRKISSLKKIIVTNRIIVANKPMKFIPVLSYNYKFPEFFSAFYVFSEIIFYANFINFCIFKYKNYIAYIRNLLMQVYKFNLQQNREYVHQKFINFQTSTTSIAQSQKFLLYIYI